MRWRWGRKRTPATIEEAPPDTGPPDTGPLDAGPPVDDDFSPHRWEIEVWDEWLRVSPTGPGLRAWWTDGRTDGSGPDDEERYRERLAEILSRAAPRDCAALGLGCSRRVDRPCRDPRLCRQDPPAGSGIRSGPVPGACSSFIDCWSPLGLRVKFSGNDRHRAVHLRLGPPVDPVGVWVDGVRLAPDLWLDEAGYWLDDRFYVVEASGPDDHPEQLIPSMGHMGCSIMTLVVHDVERATTQVLVPEAGENWTWPVLRLTDGTFRVYADEAALEADAPDRVLPAAPPVRSRPRHG
ncbi:hypothetical protein [Streptomyces sp. NPDC048338]|uniref:hypothetical protein n=1 Tax=Streptomyces sp. NPDC048338 TaxID=3365536 RepID=UPI00371916D0